MCYNKMQHKGCGQVANTVGEADSLYTFLKLNFTCSNNYS